MIVVDSNGPTAGTGNKDRLLTVLDLADRTGDLGNSAPDVGADLNDVFDPAEPRRKEPVELDTVEPHLVEKVLLPVPETDLRLVRTGGEAIGLVGRYPEAVFPRLSDEVDADVTSEGAAANGADRELVALDVEDLALVGKEVSDPLRDLPRRCRRNADTPV